MDDKVLFILGRIQKAEHPFSWEIWSRLGLSLEYMEYSTYVHVHVPYMNYALNPGLDLAKVLRRQ